MHKNLQIDGEPEFGLYATVYDGPNGEQAFGAAWITAEFQPADIRENVHNRPEFKNPADHLDFAARRMLRG